MHKLTNCSLLSMFENMFISYVHYYSTRQAALIYVQYASPKRTQRTINHFGTKLWNCLCNGIHIDCAIVLSNKDSILCHDLFPYIMLFFNLISSFLFSSYLEFIIIFLNYVLHLYFCNVLKSSHPYMSFAPCFLLTTYIWILLYTWTWAPFAKVMISLCLSSNVVIMIWHYFVWVMPLSVQLWHR